MKTKFIRKSMLVLLVSLEIFSLAAFPALAVKIPSIGSVTSQLENRYHANLQSIQGQSEYFNTADNKKMTPQVTLFFSPTAPELGEKIAATAVPIYFSSTKESMYFTWYLKHKSSGGDDGKGNWDHNDDGDVDIEDYKIEAMRLIANNGFNQNNANYSSDNDKDGYEAYFGGDDRERMPDHCYLHDFNSGINYELTTGNSSESISFPECIGGTVYCAQQEDQICSNIGGSFESASVCTETVDPQCVDGQAQCLSGSAYCITGSFPDSDDCSSDVSCSSLGSAYSGTCSINRTGSGKGACNHVFPWAYYQKDNGNISIRRDNNNNKLRAGRDSFGREEERFWHTNPKDSDTANNGNKDEANVAGLGQDTFFWNYQPGDKVGVAVEGVSNFPTKYDDASQAVMWALPKNDCRPSSTGSMTKNIKGYNVVIPIAERDLNDCLEDNLVDPLEGGQSAKLELSLSYSPENPVNDSSGSNSGDELSVHASLAGAKARNYLKYSWEVYGNNNINPESWGDPYLKSQLPEVGRTSGIGLDTLKFKLNLTDSVPKYLKVKVTASENISEGVTNEGRSEVIIPISTSSNKIHVFPAVVSPDLVLRLGAKERCDTGLDSALCPVVQNEIVGLKVDKENFTNFVWTLNGDPIQPINYQRADGKECVSGECDPKTGEATNIAFFSVLKEKGATYDIGLTANNVKGEKVTLTKKFEVTDPEIKILSSDFKVCQPVLLGNYVDLDNKQWPDYSDTTFLAALGTVISLQPILNNPFAQDLIWYIDGVALTPENMSYFGAAVSSDGILTFPAAKQLGEIYNVSVQALYAQDNNIKKFLYQTAGAQLNEFLEMTISDNIEIQMADLAGVSGAQTNTPRKFLAALFTGLPAYVSFLFRIVLTVMLILAVSWITMAFTPKAQRE